MTKTTQKQQWQVPISEFYPTKPKSAPYKKKSISKSGFNPPKHEIDAFARCILPAIQAYFDTAAGKREFAAWQQKQAESKTA